MGTNDTEKNIINIHTKTKNRKYYNFEDSEDKILRNTETGDLIQYKGYNVNFSDFIREKIEFSKGDILKDIDNIEGNNTILICRNLWPYLKENDREMLMYKIYRKFAEKNSILVLGDFDICYPYSEKSEESVMSLLDRFNFRETSVMNVYTNRAIF